MRLNLRLQKTLAVATLAAVTVSVLPTTTYASDYDKHWAKTGIERWSQKEVLKGYEDGSFKPNNTVTRGELAAILVRVFGLNEVTGAATYKDVVATKWYAGDVAKVSAAGIMNDYEDGTFKPEQEATREEAAYAIAKAYHVAAQDKTSSFTDQAQISEWAEDEIAALVAGGYLNGNPDGSFRPQATLTRAEAVTMVDKITADLVNVAGVYSQDVEGNLVVNTTGVELKDMTITGNLYLAEGIGEGEVKLTNVTVLGNVIVEGGSVNTIKVEGQSKLNDILVDKAGKNPVRLLFGNLVEVKGTVTLQSTSTLEGNVLSLKDVVIDGAKEVQLVGDMKIENLTINKTTELALVDGPTIQLVTINEGAPGTILRGREKQGSIKKMIIKANNVELKKGFKINKDNITVAAGVTGIKYPEAGGGGGTSGGNGGGTVQENKVALQSLEVTTTNGTTRKASLTSTTINVVVNNEGVKVNNTLVAAPGEEIQSVTLHGKDCSGKAVVKVLGLSADVNLGRVYDAQTVKADALDQYTNIKGQILPELKEALTEEQYKAVVAKMDLAFEKFLGTDRTTIPVSGVLKGLELVKDEFNGRNQEKINKVLAKASLLGIDITGLDNVSEGVKEVTVKGNVTLTQDGKESTTYTIKVAY